MADKPISGGSPLDTILGAVNRLNQTHLVEMGSKGVEVAGEGASAGRLQGVGDGGGTAAEESGSADAQRPQDLIASWEPDLWRRSVEGGRVICRHPACQRGKGYEELLLGFG